MVTKYTVFQLNGTTGYDEDKRYFMSRCNQLRMVTFGDTKEDAENRIRQAIEIWKKALSGKKVLTKRLTQLDISFKTIVEEVVIPEPIPKTSKWLFEEKVGVGA